MIARRFMSLVAGLLLVFVILVGHPAAQQATPTPAAPTLTDLTDLEQLRALFNQQRDTPRLLLLISPT